MKKLPNEKINKDSTKTKTTKKSKNFENKEIKLVDSVREL